MTKKKPLSTELAEECAELNRIFQAKKGSLALSQAKIADAAKMSSPAISLYLGGINALNLPIAAVFSKLLQVPISAFSPRLAAEAELIANATTGTSLSLGEVRYSYGIDRRPSDEYQILQFDTGGSMGFGLELRDQPGVIQSLSVTAEWLRLNVKNYTAAENLCIVTGFGDSMKPTYNPGDPLLVDRGVTTVEFDSVYFFSIGSEGYVKRLQRIPSESGLVIKAISDNRAAYDAFEITDGMDFQVFGRVLKVWRSEDF